MKQKLIFENALAETLLIPLYMRAKESGRGRSAILHDSTAERLVAEIDYDFSALDQAKRSGLGCVVRSWYIDDAVHRFVETHRHPVVVNLGCGLDTRAHRLRYLKRATFYAFDLPEVMQLRQRLLPEADRERGWGTSLFDTDWMDRLRDEQPDADFIFTLEGVLMFFEEDRIKAWLHAMAEHFPESEIWFDLCGPRMAGPRNKPDGLRNHAAEVRFALSDAHALEAWDPRLQVLAQEPYPKFFPERWGLPFGRMLGHFPKLFFAFSSLVGLKVSA